MEYLPDISKWDVSNLLFVISVFENCYSLKIMPDISKWTPNNILLIDDIYFGCTSLITFPDISKWNFDNMYSFNKSIFSYNKSEQFISDKDSFEDEIVFETLSSDFNLSTSSQNLSKNTDNLTCNKSLDETNQNNYNIINDFSFYNVKENNNYYEAFYDD